jgi:hypothetical protein
MGLSFVSVRLRAETDRGWGRGFFIRMWNCWTSAQTLWRNDLETITSDGEVLS